jgi:hypothetical protein
MALAFLRIPSEHQPGLIKLALLSDEVASELRSALGTAARKESGIVSANSLDPIRGLAGEDLDQIVEAVISLNHGIVYSDLNMEEVINSVTNSIQKASPTDFPVTEDASNRLKKRIEDFVTIDEVVRYSKLHILKYEHERTVNNLRILTDVRPIFVKGPGEQPEIALVVHTLKLAYHRGGRLDELYFAMDETDLRHLKEAVARAELKAKTIRAALTKAQLEVSSEESE